MKKSLAENAIFLVGPTGVGKTEISVLVAETLGAEIVSADSMQVYRGLDILTAKPSLLQQKRIPHHVIDIVPVSDYFDVVQFIECANHAITEIVSRNHVPLVVGGTGMYVRALIDGIFPGPGRDDAIRNRLIEEVNVSGKEELYQRLCEIDPEAAGRIHPNDTRRIIRALEVCILTGQPFSSLKNDWDHKKKAVIIGLTRDREELYRRIDKRVDVMFEEGVVDEVKGLLENGLRDNPGVTQAIGVKEIVSYLDGELSREKAIELIKRNSRRYAKRQYTWFKTDERIKWVILKEERSIEENAGLVLGEIRLNISNE